MDEMKEIGRFWVPSFSPRWPTNKLAGGNKRKSAAKAKGKSQFRPKILKANDGKVHHFIFKI